MTIDKHFENAKKFCRVCCRFLPSEMPTNGKTVIAWCSTKCMCWPDPIPLYCLGFIDYATPLGDGVLVDHREG